METKEIVAVLEELARSNEDAAVSDPRNEEHFTHTAKALREAIARVERSAPAEEAILDPNRPLTWNKLQTCVGQIVFVEFNDGGRVKNGKCLVAHAEPRGVSFARCGHVVRIVLAKEYGSKCSAYAVRPGEELP